MNVTAPAAGLLKPAGVFLGSHGPAYLRHDGPEHVMAFAPTRSGKGVGLVVPTLLTWPGSAVIHDIKGENWQLTAGFRAQHGRVLLFDPTNAKSSAYNPLLEVRRGEWDDATHPNARTRASYLLDNYVPLSDAGVLQLVDEDRGEEEGGHEGARQVGEQDERACPALSGRFARGGWCRAGAGIPLSRCGRSAG